MDYGKEFEKYATKHHGINSMHYDKLRSSVTPYIMEERQMNITQMDVFSRLMMDRIIFLGTGINDQVANIIQAQLLFLESVDANKDISIYINSPGGSVTCGLSVFDAMHHIEARVHTVCVGIAASMASFVLAGGEVGLRLAFPHSRIMLHQPLGGGLGQASDILAEAQEILRIRKQIGQMYVKLTGQSLARISADMNRDYFLSAYEAKDYGEFGLIDRVADEVNVVNVQDITKQNS